LGVETGAVGGLGSNLNPGGLLANGGLKWGFNGLPGSTPDNPLLPTISIPGLGYSFQVPVSGDLSYFDSAIATGYDYISSDVNFRSVLIPGALPGGQTTFDLLVNGQSYSIAA